MAKRSAHTYVAEWNRDLHWQTAFKDWAVKYKRFNGDLYL